MAADNREDLASKMQRPEDANAEAFWINYCADLEAQLFPSVPFPGYTACPGRLLEHSIENIAWLEEDITPETTIQTAWAIVQAQWTGVDDVVFGTALEKKQTNGVGVDHRESSAVAAMPLRMRLDRSVSVRVTQQHVQQKASSTIPRRKLDVGWIRTLDNDTRRACEFQTLLSIQSSPVIKCDQQPAYGLLIQCEQHTNGVRLQFNYDGRILETAMLWRILQQFEHILRELCASRNQTTPLVDLDLVSQEHRSDIWQWNAAVPDTYDACVHKLIAETVRRQPEALAIDAWDGQLTYRDLDKLSTGLAYHLSGLGVEPGTIVPLCFEKSMWATVAMVGVIKAGAAFTLLDSSLPTQRLDTMIRFVTPPVVVCSPASRQRFSTSELSIFELHSTSLLTTASQWAKTPPTVESSAYLAVVFTSGSTGTPKAAILRHSNVATGHVIQKDIFGFGPNERVYDFSSYAFDVSIGNTFKTLLSGACLCVPSDAERKNDLVESLAQRKPTIICLTTSVLRSLPQSIAGGLTRLLFGAEALLPMDIQLWAEAGNAVHLYGQAECTVQNVAHSLTRDNKAGDIGRGLGASTWCVGENGHPTPIGVVGELWLEGPLVGAGYLNDLQQTAAAFVDDPHWLLAGGPGIPGRKGRLYKTGDLVRYRPDGTLQFLTRKDGQVKVRGQRLELSEVEQHVRDALQEVTQPKAQVPLAAEVATPRGSQPTLVVFASALGQLDEPSIDSKAEILAAERGSEPFGNLARLVVGLNERLASTLPTYMIPAAYIALQSIPLTATGKVNHRRLKEMISSWTLEELAQLNAARATSRVAPSTPVEHQLQKLWAQVLRVDPDSIAADDSFLRVGGDSLQAMQLARTARKHGLHLTVADVITQPTLSALAAALSQTGPLDDTAIVPFSLLPSDVDHDELLKEARLADQIQDAYPATSEQGTFIQGAQLQPPVTCCVFHLDLPPSNGIDDARACCDAIWARFDMFRAAFVHYRDRFWTLVYHDQSPSPVEVFEADFDLGGSSDDIFNSSLDPPMQMGVSYTKFLIVRSSGKRVRLGIRLSHAQYDGGSFEHLVSFIDHFLTDRGAAYEPQPPFAGYIRHAQQNEASCLLHWSQSLKGSTQLPFLSAKLRSHPLPTDLTAGNLLYLQKVVSMPSHNPTGGSTRATRFTAACAISLGRITGVADVTVGTFVNGRAALPADLLSVFGPCLGVVPLRLNSSANLTLEDATADMHRFRTDSLAFESSTFVDTLQACTDWPLERRRYSCLVLYQDIDEEPSSNGVRLKSYRKPPRRPGLALVVSAEPVEGDLEISVTARADFYEEHELQNVLDTISAVLAEGGV